VTVSVFEGTNTTATATMVSAPANAAQPGAYSFMLATSSVPIDGYLQASKSGFIDSYLYPPFPLAVDTLNADPLLITPGTLSLLGTFTGQTRTRGTGCSP